MSRLRPVGGYSLLEMVVVLGILGLATALVGPSMYRAILSWQEASDVDAVLAQLTSLPWQARREGRELKFEGPFPPEAPPGAAASSAAAAAAGTLELPEGWRLDFTEPLVVRANGSCGDGRVELRTTRQRLGLRIAAPFCSVSRIGD